MFLFGFCFAVPLTTIVFCYGQLLITMKMVSGKPQRLFLPEMFMFGDEAGVWLVNARETFSLFPHRRQKRRPSLPPLRKQRRK